MYSDPDKPSKDWILDPAIGRIHNFLAQGRDNYAADRAVAFRLLEEDPWLGQTVRTTQVHRAAVVTYLAREHNIRQILDLGCGLPRDPHQYPEEPNETRSTYEIARTVHADAAVVFVDTDPHVAGHAGAVWAGYPTTRSICADIRAIDDLLAHSDMHIFDLDQPIGVLLHEVLPWVEDEPAHAVMDALRAWLPAGSAISLLHSRADVTPEVMDSRVAHYADAGIAYRPRTPEQIRALLAPWTPPQGRVPAPAAEPVYSTVVTR